MASFLNHWLKRLNNKWPIFICLLIPFSSVIAQDSLQTLKDIVQFNGYLKNMQTLSFQNLERINVEHLLHNRINLKAFLNDKVTVSIGLRNRVLFGYQVQNTPNYRENIAFDNGFIDMSWLIINNDNFLLHSTIDRMNVNYVNGNFEATLGRQRINWGLALVWNPNDLFNTYNFIDFDYEERPGSDAIRTKYYFKNGMSSIEVAANINWLNQTSIAGMYRFNTTGYDFQILAGKYLDDIAVGAGWAGSLGNMGFKGEATYFKPLQKSGFGPQVFVATTTLDYSFANSIYLNGAYLFSSNGINRPVNLEGDVNLLSSIGTLTPKSLFPTQSAAFLTASYPISPLWNVSLAGMYGFGMNLSFISPNVSYSIKDNLDAILIGQSFFLEQNGKMKSLGNGVNFRLKWSF